MNTEEAVDRYMKQIRKMARKAYQRMRKPSVHSYDDMVSEGVLVLLKDALPHHYPPGHPKYRANFNSFLTVCLRNHYCGMMKKSFLGHIDSDRYTIDVDPRAVYERNKRRGRPHVDEISDRILIEDMKSILTERETRYVHLLAEYPRKVIRSMMGISFHVETNIRKSIQQKIGG